MPRPGYLARAGLDDLDPGGLRSLNHVGRAAPAWKRDDQVREGLGNHALIAHGAVVRPCPVPFRQEVPFEDAVFPRPFPGNAIDAARPAVDQAVEMGRERRASDPACSRRVRRLANHARRRPGLSTSSPPTYPETSGITGT